ncbi:MAG TPA: hypothetical protein VGM39_05525 [Kofleriaceae bacterium]|jgi:hypothetical protein
MRALLSPTALALALTAALSPLAAADRIDPASEHRPVFVPAPIRTLPQPVPELPDPNAKPRTRYHVTRLPPTTSVSNTSSLHFAQPPTGWSESHSSSEPDHVAPIVTEPDHGDMRPPVIVTKSAVRAALEEARTNSLDAFKTYMTNQTYPSNTYTKGTLNVWRDADGHYCAAATIIRISGRLAISEDVANTSNNLRLITVKDGVLMDWILTSGLTQQEVDRIQMPFIGVAPDGRQGPVWAGDVDQKKKTAETARLLKAYRATYAALQKNDKASLELAVNRLMAHPDLAREFLDGSLAVRDVR